MKTPQLSIQARLAGTFIVVLAILGVGLWLQEIRDYRQGLRTRESLVADQSALVEKIIQLTGTPLLFFTSDYAPWDDMVKFVATPDEAWAHTNVRDPLANFKIEAIWVLRADGTLVYAATRGNAPELQPLLPLPLPPEAIPALVASHEPLHCFLETPLGLLEVRGEPIRASTDIDHRERGVGWLLAGELWDHERLETLASLISGTVQLIPPDAAPPGSDPRALRITRALPDWKGRPLRLLEGVFSPPALQNLEDDRITDLTVFVICGALILLVLLASTYGWIVRPLRLLTSSLADRNPRHLPSLASSSREFHELGRIIERSFAQERELREAFDAFNAIDDAVFIVDASTHAISYVNAGALRLLGYPRDEILRGTFPQLLRSDPLTERRAQFDTLSYARLAHRDGRELEVEFRRQLLRPEDAPTHYVVVARDISERRAQEKQRLRAQRLESLGALAGGIAHDLNNMLTPVSLLLDDLSDPRHPPTPDLVASVRVSVKRGAMMLRQLLTFGRGIEGDRKPIAIAELCADLGRIINSTFPKSIRLELAVPANLGDIVGDVTQLHQVLLNLCVNARDAMPDGGVLRIQASPLILTPDDLVRWPGTQPGHHILLEVRDTGEGIPQEFIDRIFDPFFTTKAPDKGTGLGLSTSLGIVRGHGGSITAESAVGHGTTFRIALPAVAATGREKADQPGLQARGDNRTVLVVEDEPLVLRTILSLLLHAGWQVMTASDGAAGLAVFTEHRNTIALVLSDISMAGTDGLEMIRRIQQLSPTVPVVVMSGRIDDVQRERIRALRLQHVLNKPFTRAELLEGIRRALAS